ncbi:MAB_1171c family putative transporter [Streptomyces sp. NPDC087212]|uniref:MAB_1171c family putative transporter n=1 Tax=Streptomyces sp. NPDC087212 TaxID=3365766 RepID=UPI00382A511D
MGTTAVVYVAAGALALSSLPLFRRPRETLRNPLTVSTCAAIVLGALVFVCSAPLTLATVNRLTGIPNFGAPLTYGMLSAYSCSLLVLMVNWRGGPRDQVRRNVWRAVAAYGLLIVVLITLFLCGDARTERLRDLDTYYARTPYLREMIVLYLLGHTAATALLCAQCLKWGREVSGLLATGLRLILAGIALDVVGFQLTKYTAVVARWTGHDLDVLSTEVAPPLASLAGLVFATGFVLPRLLPLAVVHWRSVGDYRRLGPLWCRVRFASTAPEPPVSWLQTPLERLRWREVSIHDALLALAPYFDDTVRSHAQAAALAAGHGPHRARVAAEAAMLADATRRAAAHEVPPGPAPVPYRLHATEVTGPGGLVELARELAAAPGPDTSGEGTVSASSG